MITHPLHYFQSTVFISNTFALSHNELSCANINLNYLSDNV